MANDESCRLCFSSNDGEHIYLFGAFAIELNVKGIICEHFKCEINETDSLPQSVCRTCWSTTEAFDELYRKAKSMQTHFLNPVVKVESQSIEEFQIEIGEIKVEAPIGESNDVKFDDEPGNDDETGNFDDELGNVDDLSDSDEENKNYGKNNTNDEERGPRRKRKSSKPQSLGIATFRKLFNKTKHFCDMTCDECPTTFESLEEARKHYSDIHKNRRGYIKCCSQKFSYRCQIERHLQRHTDPDLIKCPKCVLFPKKTNFDNHMKRHETVEKNEKVETPKKGHHECEFCKKVFSRKRTLEQHMDLHIDEDTPFTQYRKFMIENFDMTCDKCDATFVSLHDARSHYKKSHNEDKGYVKCCKVKLKAQFEIKNHINAHLNPDVFKCKQCHRRFMDKRNLNVHMRKHKRAESNPFICDYCGKTFINKASILQHMFNHHIKTKPKFKCHICSKQYRLEVLLRGHLYAAHREKKPSVTCVLCGKSFYGKFFLDKHMFIAHSDKSERLAQSKQCEYCGEWLLSKSGIYYHEQIHTTGVQKCKHCNAELPNKVALQCHIRKNHRETKYKCNYWEKSFDIASALKSHEEGHTRHKVYQCNFCPKVFTVQSSRRTHQRRNHEEEVKKMKLMEKIARIPT